MGEQSPYSTRPASTTMLMRAPFEAGAAKAGSVGNEIRTSKQQ
jgi:hypothetical protein